MDFKIIIFALNAFVIHTETYSLGFINEVQRFSTAWVKRYKLNPQLQFYGWFRWLMLTSV